MMVGAGVGFGHEDGCWGRLVGLDAMLGGGGEFGHDVGCWQGEAGHNIGLSLIPPSWGLIAKTIPEIAGAG